VQEGRETYRTAGRRGGGAVQLGRMASLTTVTIWSTFVCSLLSLLGSMLVVTSYMIARLTAKPKTAALISNLSITDFFWFLSSLVQSSFWIGGEDVPDRLCYVCSPVVNFTRMASLIWTCAISFDVLMSVQKRKWLWRGEETGWKEYRIRYYVAVAVFSLPGAIYNVYKQHSGDSSLGCNPGYEKLGGGVVVFFTELLPILVGFLTNLYVFFQVRVRMAAKAFPLSVRKKRRKIMYHYIIVCIICWTPTMVFYIAELSGLHSALLEVFSRISLYLTGFFNFLVFGMQDPHLKRSLMVALYIFGFGWGDLKTTAVDKTVMFGGDLSENADVSKDKKAIYRYHKLTKEDKLALYSARPDLDPKIQYVRANGSRKFTEPLLSDDDKDQEDDDEEQLMVGDFDGVGGNTEQQIGEGGQTENIARESAFNPLSNPAHTHTHPLKEDCEYITYKSDTESSSDEEDDEDAVLQKSLPELFALARSPENKTAVKFFPTGADGI